MPRNGECQTHCENDDDSQPSRAEAAVWWFHATNYKDFRVADEGRCLNSGHTSSSSSQPPGFGRVLTRSHGARFKPISCPSPQPQVTQRYTRHLKQYLALRSCLNGCMLVQFSRSKGNNDDANIPSIALVSPQRLRRVCRSRPSRRNQSR
jgi:hypothetical protein